MKTKYEASQLGIVSYDTALKALNGKQDMLLCNNTILLKYPEGTIAVILHGTAVVTYYPSGSIKLDSGGYRTVTTKDRINRFSPFELYSVNFNWLISRVHGKHAIAFVDGMIFDSDGIPYDKNGIELGVDGSPVIGGHTLARLEQSK